MVDIDTVYQRVLVLANKEQRGYITPQEFNLFANQAQMEIFEQYFYDVKKSRKGEAGNDREFSDPLSILNEKISVFEIERGSGWMSANLGAAMILPNEVYRVGTIRIERTQVEMMTSKRFDAARMMKVGAPSINSPIGTMIANSIAVGIGPAPGNTTNPTQSLMNMSYIRRPNNVSWGYVVLGEKALYDPTPAKTLHFELHASEETELIYKILKYSGASMKRQDVIQIGQGLEQLQDNKEK